MRTLAKTAFALGFIGAIAVGSTAPASAQGFYFNAPGIHIGVGEPWHSHYYSAPRPRYYDYSPGYYGYEARAWAPCSPGFTVQDGVCKPYRGY